MFLSELVLTHCPMIDPPEGQQDMMVMTKMQLAVMAGEEHLSLAETPVYPAKAMATACMPQLSPRASSGARGTPASSAKGTLPGVQSEVGIGGEDCLDAGHRLWVPGCYGLNCLPKISMWKS